MIKASLKKLRFATLGFLILLLVLSPVGTVFTETYSHSFYGSVKVDGVDANVGTVISAQVTGTEYGSWTVTTPGSYALIVQGDIDEGATIHFYVDGQEADQTFPFHDGWTTKLDLTAPPITYELTMAADPEVGGTATDLTNASPYAEGTVVSIEAEPAAGYRFVNWTPPPLGSEFGNANAAVTTFTMPGGALTVTANFELVSVVPTVTTQNATEVSTLRATLNMNYTVGDYSSVQVRFAYKKSADTEWSYTDWVSKAVDGTHAELLTYSVFNININTEYDFKAQLKYSDTVYGEPVIEGATLHFTSGIVIPCFIATAAYGTPTAEQIDVLREFRDVVLLESTVGSQFIALYYQLSPPVANFIAGNELLRTLVRELLVDPIVWVVEATGDMWRN